MNKIVLIGNITKVPELHGLQDGNTFCRFTIAVNRRRKDDNVADYFNCVAWSNIAENIVKFCTKGSKICVEGSIYTRNYKDRMLYEITVRECEFLSLTPTVKKDNPKKDNSKDENNLTPIDDGDLPF